MSGLAFFLLLTATASYSFFTVLVLAVACGLLLQGSQVVPFVSVYFFVFLSIMLVPGSALIVGAILDGYCNTRNTSPLFARIAFFGSWALAFRSELFLDFIESALLLASDNSLLANVGWMVAYLGAVFFCGAVIAFCLVSVSWLVELPLLWLGRARAKAIDLDFVSFRPIFLIGAVALSFNLIAGLFVAELWPAVIIRRLVE
jgi:hypothetical protein